MEKRLVKIGNSYGVVLDRAILELLGCEPTTIFRLTTDGRRLILEPTLSRDTERSRSGQVELAKRRPLRARLAPVRQAAQPGSAKETSDSPSALAAMLEELQLRHGLTDGQLDVLVPDALRPVSIGSLREYSLRPGVLPFRPGSSRSLLTRRLARVLESIEDGRSLPQAIDLVLAGFSR